MRAGEHIAPALNPVSPDSRVTQTYSRVESGKPDIRPVPGCFTLMRSHQMHALIPSRNLPLLLDASRLLPGRRKPSPLPVRPRPVPRTLWMWPGRATWYRCATAFPCRRRPTSTPNSVRLWCHKAPGRPDGWGGPDS